MMKEIFILFYEALMTRFEAVNWEYLFSTLKIISFVASFLLVIVIVVLLIKIKKSIEGFAGAVVESAISKAPQKIVDKQWQAVLNKVEGDNPDAYKLAVLEADKIFDDLLKRMGLGGADMGERLKQLAPNQVPNIDDIWRAHKIRNRIAHEADFQVTRAQAKMVVEIYRLAMESLEAL